MDLFPAIRSGNIHLLVITDRLTNLTRTFVLGRTRELEVANAFAKHWYFSTGRHRHN